MAEFRQFAYTNTGTEADFIQGLIDLIHSLDEDVTVEDIDGNPTTVEEQLAIGTQADFYFNFGNGQRMCLRRNFANRAGCRNYVLNGTDILYSYGNLGVADKATRSFFVTYIHSDNILFLWLGAYSVTSIGSSSGSALVIKNEDDRFANAQNNINPLNFNLVGSNATILYSPVFAYFAGAGNIDFAEKAVFTSGGSKALETEEIKSCSTVPQFTSIALPDGRNFFTVAPNAMVEIDPTT